VNEPPPVIELLGPHHDRVSFSCGEPTLDSYIRRQAAQEAWRRVARVFVAAGDTPGEIAGYYTLSAASFEEDELPMGMAKRLPHYPVPAVVIGRLAVDCRSQGRGLGETSHLTRSAGLSARVRLLPSTPLSSMLKNDRVRAFYERYGFRAFAFLPYRLFLPLQTFERLGFQGRTVSHPAHPETSK